jgi:proton-translocating NADH-quinone oxidoreductase chain M
MFILIGFWGPRARKIKAAYLLVLYTIVGSIFLLLAIFIYYLEGLGLIGSPFQMLMIHTHLVFSKQAVLWLCLFVGFAIKVPLFPVHIWLPEAHVEAPTIGSVLLAAFLLKLGLYGLIRFTIVPLFNVSLYFSPFVYILALLGTVFCALTALRQIDFKKVIAYSSVSHMNFCLLGLFSYNLEGLVGACVVMVGHGFISGALFFLIGSLYDRYHSKLLFYYGGLKQVMPIFSAFFFFFTLANISFPGTVSFIGEGLILLGLVKNLFSLYLISSLGVFFTTTFSVLKFNQLVLGSLQTKHVNKFQDLSKREVFCLLPLAFFTVLLGFIPEIIIEPISAYFKIIGFMLVSGI